MRKTATIILLVIALGGALYFAQDWGYQRGLNAKELSPRAFHCREALGQRKMAQLGLDENWTPEPLTMGRVTEILSVRAVSKLQQERHERLVGLRREAEADIERFCQGP